MLHTTAAAAGKAVAGVRTGGGCGGGWCRAGNQGGAGGPAGRAGVHLPPPYQHQLVRACADTQPVLHERYHGKQVTVLPD